MAISNTPPYDHYQRGRDWHYGSDYGFQRPECKPQLLPTNDAELKQFEKEHGKALVPFPQHLDNPAFLLKSAL